MYPDTETETINVPFGHSSEKRTTTAGDRTLLFCTGKTLELFLPLLAGTAAFEQPQCATLLSAALRKCVMEPPMLPGLVPKKTVPTASLVH